MRSSTYTYTSEGTGAAALARFATVVLVLNVVAAIVAVAVNWPSQFGATRTDAGDDVVLAGTAISAPVLPIVLLLATALLARRTDWWGSVAIATAILAALLFLTGAIGEFVAEGTEDTPKAVLVAAGVVWTLVAVALGVLAIRAALQRRRVQAGPPDS